MNALNSELVNGGPLSLQATLGMPWVAKIRINLLIVPVAAVDLTISTSENLEAEDHHLDQYEQCARVQEGEATFGMDQDVGLFHLPDEPYIRQQFFALPGQCLETKSSL